ncbi:MAG: glycosyltransferase [Roseobacter sp.]
MTRATILIPACNEAAVIGRTLLHLSRGASCDAFRIIVIANGCSDTTAQVVKSVLPRAIVLQTQSAGKCNALNLGFREAEAGKPVLCLDADVDVTPHALHALIAAVSTGSIHAACGQMDVDLETASLWVRSYYAGWQTNPYFDNGKFGGLFALSAQGAAQVFPLPVVTADDELVRRSFEPSDTAYIGACRFTVRAPRTLASLLRVRRRSLRGAREVSALGFSSPERGSIGVVLRRAVQRPSLAFPVLVYAAMNAWVRISNAWHSPARNTSWDRDLTTRISS